MEVRHRFEVAHLFVLFNFMKFSLPGAANFRKSADHFKTADFPSNKAIWEVLCACDSNVIVHKLLW